MELDYVSPQDLLKFGDSRLPHLPTTDRLDPTRQSELHQRHSTCFKPAPYVLSPGETGPTPIIVCSRGPARSLQNFYSTRYSTTFNTAHWKSGNGQGKGKGEVGWGGAVKLTTPSGMRKDSSGYSRNVVPYVEYDKRVDEGPGFNIPNPFETSQKTQFQPPQETDALLNVPISHFTESGFTHMPPKFSVISDKERHWKTDPSIMKTSYDARRLHLKDSTFDKSHVLHSESGYTNDVGHVKGFGNDVDDRFTTPLSSQTPAPTSRPWYTYKTARMDEDGYTRSHHGNILRDADAPRGARALPSQEELDRTLGRRSAEWAGMVDPGCGRSTYQLHHNRKSVLNPTLATLLHHPDLALSSKEPQGSVRNNPTHIFPDVADSVGRFKTETGDQFAAPRERRDLGSLEGVEPQLSGFTRGNKYIYVQTAQSPMAHLNPTQACARRQANKGACALKPTEMVPRVGYQKTATVGVCHC
ncbi:uncharacterized protein EV422DRAFT_511454 [Fimicolochytrium jonesii]|uniref:uncharacterized protein n=1 Tax=Fimicolochytrium jonesii TaxID=1396493 RepID=UPI0022FEE491|nr:uncharacterized protein EV422DRAFT_511454 [Fimicolochytrium jonesii]KAI8826799.1 hypothetical protein EV422DRAFT_511454 [Fimicolochytrium jonesii]